MSVELLASPPMAEKKRPGADPTMGIPPEVYAAFSAWCKRNSFVRRDVAGKVLKWFMSAPEAIRRVIVNGDDVQAMRKEYAAALRAEADRVERGERKLRVAESPKPREPTAASGSGR